MAGFANHLHSAFGWHLQGAIEFTPGLWVPETPVSGVWTPEDPAQPDLWIPEQELF